MAKFCSGTATKPPLHRHGWVAAIILPSSESPACLRAPCTEKDDGNDNDDGKSASRLGKVSENREEREVCNLVAVASCFYRELRCTCSTLCFLLKFRPVGHYCGVLQQCYF